MELRLFDIAALLLEEYREQKKIEAEKLINIEGILRDIERLLSKSVEETQKLNQRMEQIQDSIIDFKYTK